jgi:phosphatidylglycerophosphate synthase
VYWSFSIGLFIYQSMDAIDGKQARRTGMAGPLGEMFDHGCDAINVTLEVILAQAAFGYSRSWWTVASQAAAISNFYLSTWEEYHTGSLYLSAFSGPVEGILMICVMFAITAVKGPAFWTTPIIKSVPYICNVLDRRLQMLGGKGKVMDMTPMGKGVIPVLNLSQLGAKLYTSMSGVGWLRDLSIREAFMWFGAVGMLGNIANA